MLQLAAKLKAVVQSCSNHQQQVNLQVRLAAAQAWPRGVCQQQQRRQQLSSADVQAWQLCCVVD
jgi:hypothetical protein